MLNYVRELSPTHFLGFVLVLILLSRLFLIIATPGMGQHIDLSIYREAGELVVNGVDPYDFEANDELRRELWQNDHGAVPYVKETLDRYNYYVSSNLPASTALYGLIEFATGGDPFLWRVAFVLGDLLLAGAGFFFLKSAGVSLRPLQHKLAFAVGVLASPSLLLWGTILPEEKQFQTALMLIAAGLLISRRKQTADLANASFIGITLALSVLFKALGGLLLPVAFDIFRRRSWREAVTMLVSFGATALLFAAYFNFAFVQLIVQRATSASTSLGAMHGSPWGLMSEAWILTYVRPLVCLVLLALVFRLYMQRSLDLLNAMAAFGLVFICLWALGGSMDRMNITIMFALFCTATLSAETWWRLAVLNFLVQVPVYSIVVVSFAMRSPLGFFQSLDALCVIVFVSSYFYMVLRRPLGVASLVPAPSDGTVR